MLAFLAVPMLLVAPMVSSAAAASGSHSGVGVSNATDGKIGSGCIAAVPEVSVSPTSGARHRGNGEGKGLLIWRAGERLLQA